VIGGTVPVSGAITDLSFESEVFGTAARLHYLPEQVVVKGYLKTGKSLRGLIEYKNDFAIPKKKILFDGVTQLTTDFYGRTASIPNGDKYNYHSDPLLMWCQFENSFKKVPHNCSPYALRFLVTGGRRAIFRGWLLEGFIDKLIGDYCPVCHVVEERHMCAPISPKQATMKDVSERKPNLSLDVDQGEGHDVDVFFPDYSSAVVATTNPKLLVEVLLRVKSQNKRNPNGCTVLQKTSDSDTDSDYLDINPKYGVEDPVNEQKGKKKLSKNSI